MKKILGLLVICFLLCSMSCYAGNKNDLAYLGYDELAVTAAVGAADEVVVFESDIPKQGGTVQDILTLAVAEVNPMTAVGDIIIGGTSGVTARLAKGTETFALVAGASTVSWVDINPMTTAGDIMYGGASGVNTRLAAGDEANVLRGSATAPTWASGAFTAQVGVTLSELNAGKTIVAAVTGKQIVVIDFNFVMNGSFGSLTSAELEDTSATINVCSLAQAQMTDNAVLSKDTTGVTMGVGLAEGLTVSEALVISVTGSAADTATGLTVVVTYMLV